MIKSVPNNILLTKLSVEKEIHRTRSINFILGLLISYIQIILRVYVHNK